MADKSFELYELIISTQEISCDRKGCKETNSVQALDDFEACDYFFEEGWRCINGDSVCPKCRKKKTKNKKKRLNKK